MGIKILTLDIETRPNLGYVWGLWEQNLSLKQVTEWGQVISWAAKWHHKDKVHFASSYHDGQEKMLRKIHKLMDRADVIVGFNSKSFDIKHLNREFLLAGMDPPSHYQQVDLLQVARSRFRFNSNKLQHIAEQLGIGSKVQNDGWELWKGCIENDPDSWAVMREYNMHDVVLTEEVYEALLPWIPNHPHRGLYENVRGDIDPRQCPRCDSYNTHIRRYYSTKQGRWKTRQCQDCRGYFRGEPADKLASVKTKTV